MGKFPRGSPALLAVVAGALLWLPWASAPPAEAVEYRLQVASLLEEAFQAFVRRGELQHGASGPGLGSLEASMDRGEMPAGSLLYDRAPGPVDGSALRAYGAVAVQPSPRPGGAPHELWQEHTWDGRPGERSVWMVTASGTRTQELVRVAVRGEGPLRHFVPYPPTPNGARLGAVAFPLEFLRGEQVRGRLWDRYLARSLALDQGPGVVVGRNHGSLFPDHVFVVVPHGPAPTTYKVVLVWARREHSDRGNIEAGSGDFR